MKYMKFQSFVKLDFDEMKMLFPCCSLFFLRYREAGNSQLCGLAGLFLCSCVLCENDFA